MPATLSAVTTARVWACTEFWDSSERTEYSECAATGNSEFSGDTVNYNSVLVSDDDTIPTVSTSSWDGVRRWIGARDLYGFPLAVLVGTVSG